MAQHNDVGAFGEAYVASVLGAIGAVEFDSPADLRFEGVNLEVKTSRLTLCVVNRKGRWRGYQFCVHKRGHTAVEGRADFVILVCLSRERQDSPCFVIPAEQVGSRRKLALPADLDGYQGLWARYREAWELLAC